LAQKLYLSVVKLSLVNLQFTIDLHQTYVLHPPRQILVLSDENLLKYNLVHSIMARLVAGFSPVESTPPIIVRASLISPASSRICFTLFNKLNTGKSISQASFGVSASANSFPYSTY
jgi:hypothetical protein